MIVMNNHEDPENQMFMIDRRITPNKAPLAMNHDIIAAKFMPRNRDNTSSLPPDWEPTPYSVVIGRGKICTSALGNQRLQVICKAFLQQYSSAASKLEKSTIVSRIVETVQDACPQGAFIKFVNGRWWETDDHSAREKVGYVLRDLLSEKYKSSSKAKVAKRRSQRSPKKERKPVRSSSGSSEERSDCSQAPPSNGKSAADLVPSPAPSPALHGRGGDAQTTLASASTLPSLLVDTPCNPSDAHAATMDVNTDTQAQMSSDAFVGESMESAITSLRSLRGDDTPAGYPVDLGMNTIRESAASLVSRDVHSFQQYNQNPVGESMESAITSLRSLRGDGIPGGYPVDLRMNTIRESAASLVSRDVHSFQQYNQNPQSFQNLFQQHQLAVTLPHQLNRRFSMQFNNVGQLSRRQSLQFNTGYETMSPQWNATQPVIGNDFSASSMQGLPSINNPNIFFVDDQFSWPPRAFTGQTPQVQLQQTFNHSIGEQQEASLYRQLGNNGGQQGGPDDFSRIFDT